MSHYETCSVCGEPFEPVTVCSECDDAITNSQIEEAVTAERERIVALLLDDKRVQVWIPEAGDLYPVTANDLRKLFQA